MATTTDCSICNNTGTAFGKPCNHIANLNCRAAGGACSCLEADPACPHRDDAYVSTPNAAQGGLTLPTDEDVHAEVTRLNPPGSGSYVSPNAVRNTMAAARAIFASQSAPTPNLSWCRRAQAAVDAVAGEKDEHALLQLAGRMEQLLREALELVPPSSGWKVEECTGAFQPTAISVRAPDGSAATVRKYAPDPTESILYRYFEPIAAAARAQCKPIEPQGGAVVHKISTEPKGGAA